MKKEVANYFLASTSIIKDQLYALKVFLREFYVFKLSLIKQIS